MLHQLFIRIGFCQRTGSTGDRIFPQTLVHKKIFTHALFVVCKKAIAISLDVLLNHGPCFAKIITFAKFVVFFNHFFSIMGIFHHVCPHFLGSFYHTGVGDMYGFDFLGIIQYDCFRDRNFQFLC